MIVLPGLDSGNPAFAIASIPMALGVIAATVGFLGFGMILHETQPRSDTPINSRYSCRIKCFGGATSKEGGCEVNVLRYPPFLPGLELETFSRSFDDMDYQIIQLKCNLDPASPNTILIDVPSYTGSPEQIRVVMD